MCAAGLRRSPASDGNRTALELQEAPAFNDRRLGLNAVLQIGRHVNPRPRLGLDRFAIERQRCLTLDEVQDGGHGRMVS